MGILYNLTVHIILTVIIFHVICIYYYIICVCKCLYILCAEVIYIQLSDRNGLRKLLYVLEHIICG